MNGHLKTIFQIILPKLEKTGIDYWVYGGISIAAFGGKFHRENHDVDIFIKNSDFEKAKLILSNLCKENGYNLKPNFENTDRPKIEIKMDKVERFSMIPVYQEDGVIVFKYSDGDQKYSDKILEKIERHLSGYKFFTPRDNFIKEMFIKHIKARPDKTKREKIIKDAGVILSLEERSAFGFI